MIFWTYNKERSLKNKSTVTSAIFLAAMVVLTIFTLLRGQSISDLVDIIQTVDAVFVWHAVICVLVFIFLQGVSMKIMLGALHEKTNIVHCTMFSFTGFFFCSITPFQMGGPPAQMLYMKKANIPMSTSSIVVMLIAFFYKLVLVVVGIGTLIFGWQLILGPLWRIMPFFILGMLLTVGFCILLFLFIFRPQLARRFVVWAIGWAERHHFIKHKEGRLERIQAGMDRYKDTAGFFKEHKGISILVFLITAVQRASLFAVTYFVYRAFGLTGTSIFTIIILQAIISLCVDMLPIPGGMGVTEFIFYRIFGGIFSSVTLIPGLVLSRGISFYVQLVACAIVAFISHFYFKHIEKKRQMSQAG